MRRDWSGSLVGSVPVAVGSWRTQTPCTRRETALQTFQEETGHQDLREKGEGERGGKEREGERGEGERGREGEREKERPEWG